MFRSGYYEWLHRPPSRRQLENEVLAKQIKGIFDAEKQRAGSPSKYDIKVDERVDNKQSILANVVNQLHTAEAIFEFRLLLEMHTDDVIKEKNNEEAFKNSKLISILSKKLIDKIKEDAIHIFVRNEELRKAEDRLKDLKRQEEDEKKLVGDVAFQREKDLANSHLIALAERYREQVAAQLAALERERGRIDTEIESLIKMKKDVVEKYSKKLSDNLRELDVKNNTHYFDKATPEQLNSFSEKMIESVHNKNRKINSIKNELSTIDNKIKKLEDKENQRIKEVLAAKNQDGRNGNASRKVESSLSLYATKLGQEKEITGDSVLKQIRDEKRQLQEKRQEVSSESIEREIQKVEREFRDEVRQIAKDEGFEELAKAPTAKLEEFIESVSENNNVIVASRELEALDEQIQVKKELKTSIEESMQEVRNQVANVDDFDDFFDEPATAAPNKP